MKWYFCLMFVFLVVLISLASSSVELGQKLRDKQLQQLIFLKASGAIK